MLPGEGLVDGDALPAGGSDGQIDATSLPGGDYSEVPRVHVDSRLRFDPELRFTGACELLSE
jgi:hypothetical protein